MGDTNIFIIPSDEKTERQKDPVPTHVRHPADSDPLNLLNVIIYIFIVIMLLMMSHYLVTVFGAAPNVVVIGLSMFLICAFSLFVLVVYAIKTILQLFMI